MGKLQRVDNSSVQEINGMLKRILKKPRKSFKEIITPRDRKFWRAGMHSISILFLGMFLPVLILLEVLIVAKLGVLGYIPESREQVIVGGIFFSLTVITATTLFWIYFKNKIFQRIVLKVLFWFSPLNDLIDEEG